MSMMLSPDLLDRRALALLQMIDIFGRPVEGSVDIAGADIRYIRKAGGRIAITGAEGFDAHETSFEAAPAAPALQSRSLSLDIIPYDSKYAARGFNLKLPRDPDPAHSDEAKSIFAAETITIFPGSGFTASGSVCVVHVEVKRSGDGKFIENALVRGASNNGQFTASAITNHAGEGTLIFVDIPPSFPGAGASVSRTLDAKVIVTADPASALFHAAKDIPAAALAASKRKSGHVDPDAMSAAFPANFGPGKAVKIGAGSSQSIKLNWTQP